MNHAIRKSMYAVLAACLGLMSFHAQAQDPEQLLRLETLLASIAPVGDEPQSSVQMEVQSAPREHRPYRYHRRHDSGLVSIGHDSHLPAGEKVSAVVSVFGSSTAEGEVEEGVVSILGSSHVTGPVGDAVVAILGDVYVNSKVDGDVVAILGSVELGPYADVGGDVVVIGGVLTRDPAALIRGAVNRVAIGQTPKFDWARDWVKNCLLLGRPLALTQGVAWAWWLAFGFLAFYMLLALMFRGSIDRCVQTLESQPGRSTVASILTLVLTPVAFVVLCFTIIGIALVPFLWIALMCAGLFGKAVILAALGRRVTRHFGDGLMAHTAVAVFIGGLFVMALYLVPVLGFITFKLLGILGLGVVVYTLILAMKASRRERNGAVPPPGAPMGEGSAAFTANDANPSEASMGNPPGAQASGSAQPEVALTLLPRAGFWIRMGALLIDIILIGVVMQLITDSGGFGIVILAAYGAVMWKLRGSTIGGIVCGLKVVRFDGRPVDWTTAIVRALGCFLSLIVVGLGFFWIAFDDQRQGWHDKIAGTLVVRAPRGTSLV